MSHCISSSAALRGGSSWLLLATAALLAGCNSTDRLTGTDRPSVLADAAKLDSLGLVAAKGTTASDTIAATVTLDLTTTGAAVNRKVLGTNAPWTNRGEGLLSPDGQSFDASAMALATRVRPSVVRYPGGSFSDTYDWRSGMGTSLSRKTTDVYFSRAQESVTFGTPEFLEFCRQLGADPLITVNALTMSASETAEWVRAVNKTGVYGRTGLRLPSVKYWELGNEPYLSNDARPELSLTSANYASRANALIRAMRGVDSTISLGLPMMPDQMGGIKLPQQVNNYANDVLSRVTEKYDYVTMHIAYYPFMWDPKDTPPDTALFRATMAASRLVERDFADIRSRLATSAGGKNAKLAVTEYNALFTLNGTRDQYINTLGGALYIADLLRVFAQTSDLLMANHWSLISNWEFGAMTPQHTARPALRVLEAYNKVLNGRLVPATVAAPNVASRAVGIIPKMTDTPSAGVLATREGTTVRLMLLNRDATRPTSFTLGARSGRFKVLSATVKQLTGASIYDVTGASGVDWATKTVSGSALPMAITLPAHSLGWVELQLGS